jgi:hypothetical protein
MPTYLELAYRGNYVAGVHDHLSSEIFTYKGRVYLVFTDDDTVLELVCAKGLFIN